MNANLLYCPSIWSVYSIIIGFATEFSFAALLDFVGRLPTDLLGPKNIQGRVMKTGKEAGMFGQTEKSRGKTILLIVLLVIVSLFLGVLPTLSFGNPFQIASDNGASSQGAPAFGMDSPPAPGNSNTTPPYSQPSPPPTFSSLQSPAPSMTPPKPASTDFSAAPMPAPAAINPAMTSAATPAPVLHPTTNPTLGGPAPINQPHRPIVENTPPRSAAITQPAPKTSRTTIPVQERTVQPKSQTSTAHFVSSEPSFEQLKQTPNLLRSVADPKHPFAGYFEVPKAPVSKIRGESLSIANLLDGVGSPQARSKLLEKYWELTGLMVQYNVRMDSDRFIRQMMGQAGADRNLMSSASSLAQQRCRVAELEFSKTQLQLAELLKQAKGMSFSDDNLPIPCDYPIYKKYETYLDRIAVTEKAKYLGRMIPIQEQLLATQRAGCEAAAAMLQNSMQSNPRDLVWYLNQRTTAFCDMIDAVIDYNKLIAEYTSETIGPGVSQYRLVGAVIELPNYTSTIRQSSESDQPIQTATPIPNYFGSVTQGSEAGSDVAVSANVPPRAIDLASYTPEAEQSPVVQEPMLISPVPSAGNPTYANENAPSMSPPQPLPPSAQPDPASQFQPNGQLDDREPPKLGKAEQRQSESGTNQEFAGQQGNHDFMPESGMLKSRANGLRAAAPAGIDMPQTPRNEAKEIQPVSFVQENVQNSVE